MHDALEELGCTLKMKTDFKVRILYSDLLITHAH